MTVAEEVIVRYDDLRAVLDWACSAAYPDDVADALDRLNEAEPLAEAVGVKSPATPTDDHSRTPLPEGSQVRDPNGVVWTLGAGGFWYDGSGFRAYSVVGEPIDNAPTDDNGTTIIRHNWPDSDVG